VKFFSITKPGIIFGNIVTVSGGFLLGYQQHFNILLLLITLIGMSLIIASGCVVNNFIDKDIDKLMERTKDRVLAKGEMSGTAAMVYAIILGILGFAILYAGTNLLTVLVAFIGWVFYVIVYSLWLKRKSGLGTIVGGVAGAVPPVVGYCAVTNRFDLGAILLFLILFLWQLPHFYAIAIYRLNDYKAASIPVLPIRKGIHYTKISMLIYIAAFTLAAISLSIFDYAGYIYFAVALILGITWFCLALQGFKDQNETTWAKKVFLFSIIAITLLSLAMAIKI
jgi:protoheme IX farnesyltransferase